MASERVGKILWKIEAPFSAEEIAVMPEGQAWGIVRQHDRKLREIRDRKRLPQVCLTGFKASDKERLKQIAIQAGFEVKDAVTQRMVILITGENVGPNKLESAKAQNCTIMS